MISFIWKTIKNKIISTNHQRLILAIDDKNTRLNKDNIEYWNPFDEFPLLTSKSKKNNECAMKSSRVPFKK